MTQQITLNGTTYSDDGGTGRGMADGAFRENFIPMCGDLIVVMADQVAAASQEVDDATNQAAIATQQANIALGAATSTVTGPGSTGTSTTSLTVGLGTKSLIIQPGKTLYPGMPMTIAASASPVDAMYGPLVSYNSGTGAMEVRVTNLSVTTPGTYITATSWTVSLSGPAGVAGVLNEFKGAPIASAATINLDVATGNYLHLTGSTGPVASVTLAQGVERIVTLDSTPTFVNSANLILPTAANVIGEAGDVITFRGEGGGVTKVTDWVRASGKALAVVPVVPPGLVLLAHIQPTGTASVELLNIFSDDFDNYVILANGIAVSSGNTNLAFQFGNSGTADSTTNYWTVSMNSGGGPDSPQSTSNLGNIAAGGTANLDARIKNVNDATGIKSCVSELIKSSSAAIGSYFSPICGVYRGGKVSGIRFFFLNGANFVPGGHIRVFGVRNS